MCPDDPGSSSSQCQTQNIPFFLREIVGGTSLPRATVILDPKRETMGGDRRS